MDDYNQLRAVEKCLIIINPQSDKDIESMINEIECDVDEEFDDDDFFYCYYCLL